MTDYEPLWRWVRKREQIRRRKEAGRPMPWTTDPILSKYRFCCPRREDDRGTVWIRKHVRKAFSASPNLWLMLCIARQINWPDTLAELIDRRAWPEDQSFLPSSITRVLADRKARGDKVYTGAYMISAPSKPGADKGQYIAETVIGGLWARRDLVPFKFSDVRQPRLQEVHAWLVRSDGWGNFMAYQAVLDMAHTALLADAPDREIWAAAGPGTVRGLNRIHGRQVDGSLAQDRALREIRAIWESDGRRSLGVDLEFSDVTGLMCEFDKYERVRLGQGAPRALYVPGRGS